RQRQAQTDRCHSSHHLSPPVPGRVAPAPAAAPPRNIGRTTGRRVPGLSVTPNRTRTRTRTRNRNRAGEFEFEFEFDSRRALTVRLSTWQGKQAFPSMAAAMGNERAGVTELKLGEIARMVGGEIVGPAGADGCDITGLARIDGAGPGEITFVGAP